MTYYFFKLKLKLTLSLTKNNFVVRYDGDLKNDSNTNTFCQVTILHDDSKLSIRTNN